MYLFYEEYFIYYHLLKLHSSYFCRGADKHVSNALKNRDRVPRF